MRILISIIVILYISSISVFASEENVQGKKIILEKDEILHYQLPYIHTPFIDQVKLDELMNSLEQQLYQPPIDAAFDENYKILEGKPGTALNRYEFQMRFINAFYDSDETALEIPAKSVLPRVDAGLLKEISQKRLGSYVTRYQMGNKGRAHNIVLSAQAINGKVIFPGEIFSFNEIVGERTKERGYQKAQVIVQGEFAEDIGGGICQVSSTLFNAADLQGIQIIERYTHSRSVPYVPPGRDATVSWWGPDFVFKNMYNEPIVIRARAVKGILSVEILSSAMADYFKGD